METAGNNNGHANHEDADLENNVDVLLKQADIIMASLAASGAANAHSHSGTGNSNPAVSVAKEIQALLHRNIEIMKGLKWNVC
jgi:hypothetical protein